MKKFLVLFLSILLCLSLVACDLSLLEEGEDSADTTKAESSALDSDTESEETTKKVTSSKKTLKIASNSMSPTFKAGNVIRYEDIDDKSTLQVGDIIVYWSIIGGERSKVAHRIVAIYDGDGYLIFETKGDANPVNDELTVHESEIIGKFVEVVK